MHPAQYTPSLNLNEMSSGAAKTMGMSWRETPVSEDRILASDDALRGPTAPNSPNIFIRQCKVVLLRNECATSALLTVSVCHL